MKGKICRLCLSMFTYNESTGEKNLCKLAPKFQRPPSSLVFRANKYSRPFSNYFVLY